MTEVETTQAGTDIMTIDFDGSDDETAGAADVFVSEKFTDSYGTLRAALDGKTFDAKDVIKFDWHTTHHKFDGDSKEWIVDAAALDTLEEKLAEAGFTFSADAPDAKTDGPLFELHGLAAVGDHIEIEYEKKNKNGSAFAVGEITNVSTHPYDDTPQVSFRRDDDAHLMYVRYDSSGKVALYTSGSAYPYVGRVLSVELHDAN